MSSKNMKRFIIALLCVVGCGVADHEKERKDVCEHIEGTAVKDCNAGDDFSPLTCITAFNQFEGWWRDDAQTAVNNCLISSACYASAEGVPGPSVQVPLQFCLGVELFSSLKPTSAETHAVSRFCTKANDCGELGDYSVTDCQSILLNPYDDGPIFLMMNDAVSNNVANCDKLNCVDFNNCVNEVLQSVGASTTMNGVGINMPLFLRTK